MQERIMQKPFVPARAAGSVAAALVSADPRVLKGQALFQAQSCNACHGEGGVGTAAAGPLTGMEAKYSEAQLIALLQKPDERMTAGGMTALDLKQDDLEALAAYVRQLH
jgi:ubiquinol-cytochrome c reductase cytochrome b subunit